MAVLMLKFTAQSDGQWCEKMLVDTIRIIDQHCCTTLTRVVLAWDADNYGANDILDRIITGVSLYVCEILKIHVWYAMGTFRKMVDQGNGWGSVLPNMQQMVSYDQYPDPRNIVNSVTDSFHKLRAQGMSPNHNGWLGSYHLQQRKTQYHLSWEDVRVIVLGSPPSWTTERQLLGPDVKAWVHNDRHVGWVEDLPVEMNVNNSI